MQLAAWTNHLRNRGGGAQDSLAQIDRRNDAMREVPNVRWDREDGHVGTSREAPPLRRRQRQDAHLGRSRLRSARFPAGGRHFAEVSIGFHRVEDLEAALPEELRREALPWDAVFPAGKALLAYRRRGGSKHAPLPDFYIGAHAAVNSYTLLRRDAKRYRPYFPSLPLIAPPDSSD